MKTIRTLLGASATALTLAFIATGMAQAQAPAAPAAAAMMTEKKVFEMPSYTTFGGKTIKNVKFGYETYGKLNAAGDNAIFIAHFYSGNSHAAGKYKAADVAPGYWDSIIGAGKPIDTDKFFVISADTLSNLNTKDPMVTTTGPSSINADTGKPYGMSFPVIAMRDSVAVHKALVDSLGVKKLYAVAGASGGSVQAVEWTVLYPDFVDRAIPVISPGLSISPWAVALLDIWVAPAIASPVKTRSPKRASLAPSPRTPTTKFTWPKPTSSSTWKMMQRRSRRNSFSSRRRATSCSRPKCHRKPPPSCAGSASQPMYS